MVFIYTIQTSARYRIPMRFSGVDTSEGDKMIKDADKELAKTKKAITGALASDMRHYLSQIDLDDTINLFSIGIITNGKRNMPMQSAS